MGMVKITESLIPAPSVYQFEPFGFTEAHLRVDNPQIDGQAFVHTMKAENCGRF